MNRIFTEQLTEALTHRLAAVYCLVGQDPLLSGESRDLIVHTATAQGFDEKVELQIDTATDWNGLFERCQSVGLFFKKQIIILNLPENPTALLQTKLAELMSLLNRDVLLILQLAKLTKPMEKQEWFKRAERYEPRAVLINCQTPTTEQLPRWVTHRSKSMGLTIEQDAVQLLCYNYENNLLALKQSLQLLALLYPDNKLTFARVKNVVEQAAVFTPFQWVDALLEGKEQRARRILKGLWSEDVQPVILLRTLQRELMILLELAKPHPDDTVPLDAPLPIAQLREGFDRLKVWQNRRSSFTQAFRRLTYRNLYLAVQQLAELERTVKRDFGSDIRQGLEDLSVHICTPH